MPAAFRRRPLADPLCRQHLRHPSCFFLRARSCTPLSPGAEDVKRAAWFGPRFDWLACYNKQMEPPVVPKVASDGDVGCWPKIEEEGDDMVPELTGEQQLEFEEFDDF